MPSENAHLDQRRTSFVRKDRNNILQNIGSSITDALHVRASRPVIAFVRRTGPDIVLDGAKIAEGVSERAAILLDWLGPRKRLVLAMPKDLEFALLLLACLTSGISVVPVAVPRRGSKLERFAHILQDSKAAAVLCADESRQTVSEAMQGIADCPLVTAPLIPADLPFPGTGTAEPSEALVQYTSGSTQMPKGVCITGANIMANAALVGREWGMDKNAIFVNWLPHFHDMGLMGGILYPLLCGGFSAQIPSLDFIRKPALWLNTIDRYRANFSGGPAFGFAEVIRRVSPEALEGLDLSCWSKAFCGAEPIPHDLGHKFHSHLAGTGFQPDAFFACYGLAEMTLFAAGKPGPSTVLPPDRPGPTAPQTAMPCTISDNTRQYIRIADPETGLPLPNGHEGEILLSGPSQGAKYLSLKDETDRTFRTRNPQDTLGWLRTGDLGRINRDALFVTGRIKDIVICHGRNIAAPEIERLACMAHGSLNHMAAAAFAPNPSRSGEVVIVAEWSERSMVDETSQDTKHAVARALSGEWGLRLIEIITIPRGRLPRTTSGKIRRAAIARDYRAGLYIAPSSMGVMP